MTIQSHCGAVMLVSLKEQPVVVGYKFDSEVDGRAIIPGIALLRTSTLYLFQKVLEVLKSAAHY